jgi:hypothetical protein
MEGSHRPWLCIIVCCCIRFGLGECGETPGGMYCEVSMGVGAECYLIILTIWNFQHSNTSDKN